MKHLRYWSLIALAVLVVLVPSVACGPDFPSAVFTRTDGPDHIERFVAGDLGVLQAGYHSRDLAVAYRILLNEPLSAEEQQQAIAADRHFTNPDYGYTADGKPDPPPPGFDAWLTARGGFGPVDGYVPDGSLPNGITAGYNDITNCLDGAFATAAATLKLRAQQHGATDPDVMEWVRGQDAVFSNCSDGKPQPFFGPGTPPAAPPAPHLPRTLSEAPQWLAQDRAYQTAAAQFYAMHFDLALAAFQAIAAEKASPWSPTAQYVEARVLLRKATLGSDPNPGHGLTAQQMAAEKQQMQDGLAAAQQALLGMRAEPRMASLRDAIDNLLDYVNARLDPDQQTITLSGRILTPGAPHLEQTLIDFTALHTQGASEEVSLGGAVPQSAQALAARQALLARDGGSNDLQLRAAASLAAWVDDLNTPNAADALARWKASHATPWLVAAMLFAKPGDPDVAALHAAAKAIPTSSPAYLTVTYHRLRLMQGTPASRDELLALLPQIQHAEGPSTVNAFTALLARSSPTMEAWLTTAGRTPAAEVSDSEGPSAVTMPKEDVCGQPVSQWKLFDTDAAVALNRAMPLRLLAEAAESHALPENLRFQVAQAAMTRAVLLDQPAIALRMAPILEGCRAAWKPVMDAYAAAKTPADQHAEGLLLLMRFASTVPSVWEGEERRAGFATYDDMRENWWCSAVPMPGGSVDESPASWGNPWSSDGPKVVVPPPPAFLTAADLAEAKSQVAMLEAMPIASTYFAHQALDWFQAHPQDPRDADLLGEADRVLRNSCRYDPNLAADAKDKKVTAEATAVLAQELFETLHKSFPDSAWAKRYKTWQ